MAIDILLVNPLFLRNDPVEQRLMTPYFPLGLLYLAATLRQAGYSVAIYDGMFQQGPQHLSRALDRLEPAVVGISVLSTVRQAALELATLAHRRGCLVLVGGADPTARPARYLEHRLGDEHVVDCVVVGEGEETLLELLPALLGYREALPRFLRPGGNRLLSLPMIRRCHKDRAFPEHDRIRGNRLRWRPCCRHNVPPVRLISTVIKLLT